MKRIVVKLTIIFVIMFLARGVFGMTSPNYSIEWDSINSGGEDTSSSANYSIKDTLGGLATGPVSSANYFIQSGYRLPDDLVEVLMFDVRAEDFDSQVVVVSGGFDDLNREVEVVDASGFALDDYIGVVENWGADQEVAVGKIQEINLNVITVDAWEGDNATMETIDGTSDFVYNMSTNIVPLGTLSVSAVNSGISMFEVTTNATSGYTVQIREDNNLAQETVSNDIDDVVDGAVSSGSEEYGIETIGQDAQGVGDWAITGVAQNVALNGAEVTARRTITSYKASIDASTAAGFYQHKAIYTCTGTF